MGEAREHPEGAATESGPRRLALVALASALAIFALDVWLPLGVAVPSLYLGVVLLGLWSPRRRFALAAAVLCGVLTVLAPFLWGGGRAPAWIETLNRPLMLLPLLLGALVVARFKTVGGRLAQEQAEAAEERRRAHEAQRAAEAARWQQESLARTGEMAAVVAHEVRNPLAGVKGVLQVVGQRLPAGSEEQRALREAALRLDALQGLTEELLLFARPHPPAPVPLRLDALVRETVDLIRADRALGAGVVEIRGDPSPVRADPQQLRAAILNLLRNAVEASGEQGRVWVDVRDAEGAVELRVEDEGPGVPAELRERVFEPFFTTRARGTGLGLALVRRVVEAHGGVVTVGSAPGGGASFRLRLPAAAAARDDR